MDVAIHFCIIKGSASNFCLFEWTTNAGKDGHLEEVIDYDQEVSTFTIRLEKVTASDQLCLRAVAVLEKWSLSEYRLYEMSQTETNFLIRKFKYRFLTFSTYFVGEQDYCSWAEESQSDLRSLSFFNFIVSLASSCISCHALYLRNFYGKLKNYRGCLQVP